MGNFAPKWISEVQKAVRMLLNERGEVVIPFLDSVDEAQQGSVKAFVTNSGATQEDLASYKSFDEFLSGYKPKVTSVDWTSTLDNDQKALLGVKGWKTPSDVIKGYSGLEKLVGHEKIAMPKKDANGNYEKGEFERVMTQLGLPKDAKDYKTSKDFKLPEGVKLDEKLMGEFNARAREKGILPSQYEFMMDELAGLINRGAQAQKEANEKAFNESMLNLRSKWGLAYDQKAKLANNILATYGGEKGAEIVKKYGNDPAIIELLATVGGDLSEESLERTNVTGTLLDPAAANAEIAKIRAERSKELMNENDPAHKYWVDKLNELYRMAG